MKKTRVVHSLYKHWQKLPKSIQNLPYFEKKCLVGKWHYTYQNENGKIGIVRLNNNLEFLGGKNFCYEACGSLEYEQFSTLSKAEEAIYKKLGEKYVLIKK